MGSAGVTGQESLTRLAKRLKEQGNGGFKKELRRGIKKAADPAVRDVRRAAETIPVRGARGGGMRARRLQHVLKYKRKPKGGFGLRATIARATRADIKTTGEARVTIRTFARYLPPSQRKLARYLDRTSGWRHPVFGDRENWVSQYGAPWFAETLKRHGPQVRREILAAMHIVAEKITKE